MRILITRVSILMITRNQKLTLSTRRYQNIYINNIIKNLSLKINYFTILNNNTKIVFSRIRIRRYQNRISRS